MRRIAMAAAVAVTAMLMLVTPAGATDVGSTTTPHVSAIPCAVFPGHYCAKVFFTSVSNGVRINQTRSTGYTRGFGKAREWFRYSCTAGTCFILPSQTFFYNHADVQLNVTRTFSGSGFFLPCGAVFGVQYRLPNVNGPAGFVKFTVTC